MLKTLSLLALSIVLISSVYKEKTYAVGQIKTPKGEILFQLYDETPNHKASFIKLANQHYWDTLTFNRVINNFVAQGGCPDTPAGFSDSPYLLKPEFGKKYVIYTVPLELVATTTPRCCRQAASFTLFKTKTAWPV